MSRPVRKWQNLINRKCPICDARLEDKGQYLGCTLGKKKTDGRDCFFIKKTKAIDALLDINHPANRFLNDAERQMIDAVVGSLKEPEDDFKY